MRTTHSQHGSAPAEPTAFPWPPAPTILAPAEDEVHVWRASLEADSAKVQRLEHLLSSDERERADRFHFPRDRAAFVVARGTLRHLLGRYLDADPEQLRFSYTSYGKPSLHAPGGSAALRFNLSHSGGLVLYAVSHGRELGIDVETIRTQVVEEPLAERFFAPGEVAALRSLPAGQQPEAFFACWTRKEAYIKAKGEGLSMPLESFEVSLLPGEPAALRRTEGDPDEAGRWSLVTLEMEPGYAAALAVQGHDWRLRCWEWDHAG